jgi:uncharacterized protein YecT (DUF1311 family)
MLLLLAALALQPPVIRERFTPLPCPKHQVSTLDSEGCYEQQILATDRQIDAEAKRIFRLLRLGGARADFVRGERAWLSYRNASCSAESSKYAGGTEAGVVAAACTAERSRTHLVELETMRKTLATP